MVIEGLVGSVSTGAAEGVGHPMDAASTDALQVRRAGDILLCS